MIVSPRPAQMNHSGRAATAKSAPTVASADPATEPHSATPILTPTCLLVEATADAAPARSVGMPLTAAVVTGALTNAKPLPNTAKTVNNCHTGVVAFSRVSINAAAVIKVPATNSDGRLPKRPTSRPESGEKISAPTATGR
jgi:hypothetical protein